MSNLHAIYSEATRIVEEKEDNGQSQSDETFKLNWLNSPQTKEYFEQLGKKANELFDITINLAISYPQTKNHEQIIQNLVRIDTYRKMIEYGRTN